MANTNLYLTDGVTPITWGSGVNQTYQLDLYGADSGVLRGPCRAGQKGDLGASRAEQFYVQMDTSCQSAPTAGTSLWLYWAQSPSGQAATENPANLPGSAAIWNGPFGGGDVTNGLRNLDLVGVMSLVANTGVQSAIFYPFSPMARYGMPVVYMNDVNVQLASGLGNHSITFYPVVDQGQ
jgi:hypothetical protein